jgi:hypothetical protein
MNEKERVIIIPTEWKPGIPDELTLECPYCNRIPEIDYLISDELWNTIVPQKYKLGVICFRCFVKLAKEKGFSLLEIISKIKEMFYATEDYTIGMMVGFIYDLEKCKEGYNRGKINDQ